jgi:hypothetical protein
VIVVQVAYSTQSSYLRKSILPEMSLAYEDLSSTGTPLSILALANDYLTSGHCERDDGGYSTKVARVIRSWPIISTAPICISHITT